MHIISKQEIIVGAILVTILGLSLKGKKVNPNMKKCFESSSPTLKSPALEELEHEMQTIIEQIRDLTEEYDEKWVLWGKLLIKERVKEKQEKRAEGYDTTTTQRTRRADDQPVSSGSYL